MIVKNVTRGIFFSGILQTVASTSVGDNKLTSTVDLLGYDKRVLQLF